MNIRIIGGRKFKVEYRSINARGYRPWRFYALMEWMVAEDNADGSRNWRGRAAWHTIARPDSSREAWAIARKEVRYDSAQKGWATRRTNLKLNGLSHRSA